ncbi:MAG: hypothetical protein ACI8T1_001554 [Verrucomicrobiales bacterium]
MYARKVQGKELTFAVSGKLWNRSLVMVDNQTDSLWSHLLGKSMEGELKGTQLETLPGVIMTWKAWKEAHPKTSVLKMSRTADEFVKAFHESPGRFVLGVRSETAAKAYSFESLKAERVINDVFEKGPIIVLYDPEGTGGRVFSRSLDGKTLTFRLAKDRIIDGETKSIWDLQGKCMEGPLKGKSLKEIPAIPSFTKAWAQFYPDGERYQKR